MADATIFTNRCQLELSKGELAEILKVAGRSRLPVIKELREALKMIADVEKKVRRFRRTKYGLGVRSNDTIAAQVQGGERQVIKGRYGAMRSRWVFPKVDLAKQADNAG